MNRSFWLGPESQKVWESIVAMGTHCEWCEEVQGTFQNGLTWRNPYMLCKVCALRFDGYRRRRLHQSKSEP